ncbi:Os08g0410900, partial [Oryza sativa Japonica Group]
KRERERVVLLFKNCGWREREREAEAATISGEIVGGGGGDVAAAAVWEGEGAVVSSRRADGGIGGGGSGICVEAAFFLSTSCLQLRGEVKAAA